MAYASIASFYMDTYGFALKELHDFFIICITFSLTIIQKSVLVTFSCLRDLQIFVLTKIGQSPSSPALLISPVVSIPRLSDRYCLTAIIQIPHPLLVEH